MKSYSIPSTADFLMPPTSAVMNATGLSLKVVRGAVSKINNNVISVYAPGNSSSVEVFGFLFDISTSSVLLGVIVGIAIVGIFSM